MQYPRWEDSHGLLLFIHFIPMDSKYPTCIFPLLDRCHDRDIRSPCTLISDRVHTFAVRLLYVLPFPFLSICPVSPPIGEHIVRSVSLFDYLICFLSCFRLLYVPVPVPLLIRYSSVIRLSHLPYLLSPQRDCARRSSVIPTPRTSPHPFYLV